MKRLFILIFFIVFLSFSAFAYYDKASGYEVRFMPGAFGSNDSASGYNVRSNAGDYPGDTFNTGGYTGEFQDYDLDRGEAPGPTPTPQAAVSGGGGGGAVGGIYVMNIERLCVNEKSKITVSPSANGQLLISYEKDDKWFFVNSLEVRNGIAYFTPDFPGRYRFDFKIFNNLAATTESVAHVCTAGQPFVFPSSLGEETKVKEESPEVLFESKEGKPVAVVSEKKKVKISALLPITASLALVLGMIFVFRRSGENKEKQKKKVKAKQPIKQKEKKPIIKLPKPFLKLRKKSSLDELDSDLSRIKSELGELKRKYKF